MILNYMVTSQIMYIYWFMIMKAVMLFPDQFNCQPGKPGRNIITEKRERVHSGRIVMFHVGMHLGALRAEFSLSICDRAFYTSII